MKKGLSRAELKAAKNLLKKLIEKGEFDSDDKLQAEVVVGMIEEIESWESHWDYNNSAQTTISRLHDGYSSTTYEDLTCLLRGMSILYNLYDEGGLFYVTTTHDLEAFSFNRKSTEYAAITLLKRVSNITMKFKETRPYNEGASYYRATWSKLAQKIDADNELDSILEESAVSIEAQEVAIQAEIENAKAEAELTIQFDLQAANNVEITAEDDGSNDDAEEDFLATYDASIDEDSETDELIDKPEEVKEMTYEVNTYIYKGGSSKNTVKDFKTAVEAYDYLQKKAKRYAGTTDWAHSIDIWDGKHYSNIYRNDCNGNEQTTDAEIQALIDNRDFEIEVNINAREAKLLAEDIDGNYGLAGEELFDFLIYYYEKTGTYFENAGIHARKVLKDWLNAKETEKEISEYAVTPEAVEVAVQAEIENAVAEKVKQIELESCLWWINKTAELVAETRKKIEKEALVKAKIGARWDFNGVLTEYARKILGKGFVGTCFDNSRCCFFPQIKCRASYHKELADSVLYFSTNEIYAWVKDYGDGGIHIHGIQDDGGKGWGSTIDLADYENFEQFEAALRLIKARMAKPRYGYVVDVPEVKEVQTEIDNASSLQFDLQSANNAEDPAEEVIEYTCVTLRKGSCSGGYFNPEKRFSTLNDAVRYALIDKNNRFDWDEYYDGALVTINGERGIWRITAEGTFETLDASECADIDTAQNTNIEKEVAECLSEIKFLNRDIENAKSRMENAKYWGKTEDVSENEKDLLKEEKAKAKELSKLAELKNCYPKIYDKAIKVEKEKYGAYFYRTYSGIES